jgi:PAS domain S-box-containing protein
MEMRVGEFARRTGVGVSTLRAWERRFHFLEPQRSSAGQRLYGEPDVERVEAVLRLLSEGLTLPAAIARVSSLGAGDLDHDEGEAILFGQILQTVNQGVWVSREGRTLYANRKMAQLMDCSVDDLVARPVLDFHDPEDLADYEQRGALVRAGKRVTYTQKLRRGDGSTFLAEGTAMPFFNQAGQYEGAIALVDDVTGRTEAEGESRFRDALLDAIGEAVVAARPDGTILYANPAAEQLFGWRLAELIGQNGLELLPTSQAAASSQEIHSRILQKRGYSGELELTRRDGTQFVAHLTGSPVLDAHGEVLGLIATLRDNSEIVRLEQERHIQDQQAETVALLGARALQADPEDDDSVLVEAVEAIRRVLQADHGLFVAIGGDRNEVRVASPHDDEPGVIPRGSRSLAGYTALAAKVVILEDANQDRRFDLAPRPALLGLRSAIAAPVFGRSGVCGVLTAACKEPRRFNQSAAHFMQSIANIVGIVVTERAATGIARNP